MANTSYKDEPRPEYAPKKNSVNKPRAASPPTVATIQRGTLPISLILIIVIKNKGLSRTNGLTKYSNWRNSLRKEQLKQRLEVDPSKVKYGLILLVVY